MFSSSRLVLGNLAQQFCRQAPQRLQQSLVPCISTALFHVSAADYMPSRHGGFNRKDYNVLRERPVGPHKRLAPGEKYDGRVGPHLNYRYIIHYPKDGKYTINKLRITKLGGRDPVTGRHIIAAVGGGSKQKARWIDWNRVPADWPRDGPDLVEKVISIHYDPMRKPMIALTGYNDKLRWQIATAGMQEGDLITTTTRIPTIPVKPVPGNSYPLGALPTGTQVCLVQKYPHKPVSLMPVHPLQPDVLYFQENAFATIQRKVGDRVVIEDPIKHQLSFDQHCQCVVGKISIHPLKALPIGSPNRMRWLGIRPRSGFWQRKTGRHGRKIRALPPVARIDPPEEVGDKKVVLTLPTEGTRGRLKQKTKPFPIEMW